MKGLMKIKYKAELDKCLSDLSTCQNLVKKGFPVVSWDTRVQVTTPEKQTANDIKLVLEYTIS
jgi:hypothetical protein